MMATLYHQHTVLEKIFGLWTPFSTPMTARARKVMEQAHETQVRKTGEPYCTHPTAVARRCFQLYRDQTLVTAALLHDVLEDAPEWTTGDIKEHFGSQVSFLVDGLTKTSLFLARDRSLTFSHYHHKLLWVGLEDIRVFVVKLADREHNLSTLRALSITSQFRILLETITFYIPLTQLLPISQHRTLDDLRTEFFQTVLQHGLLTPSGICEYLDAQGNEVLTHTSIFTSREDAEQRFAQMTNTEQQQVLESFYTCCAQYPLLP